MARRGAAQRSTEIVKDDGAATPALISPPESKTPPTASHKRNKSISRNSEPVDASALSKALKDFEKAGKARERTPIPSPSRKRPRIQGDRSVGVLRTRCYSQLTPSPDSFLTAQAKIYKPASTCFMMMVHQPLLPSLSARHTTSCTSRKVRNFKSRSRQN